MLVLFAHLAWSVSYIILYRTIICTTFLFTLTSPTQLSFPEISLHVQADHHVWMLLHPPDLFNLGPHQFILAALVFLLHVDPAHSSCPSNPSSKNWKIYYSYISKVLESVLFFFSMVWNISIWGQYLKHIEAKSPPSTKYPGLSSIVCLISLCAISRNWKRLSSYGTLVIRCCNSSGLVSSIFSATATFPSQTTIPTHSLLHFKLSFVFD